MMSSMPRSTTSICQRRLKRSRAFCSHLFSSLSVFATGFTTWYGPTSSRPGSMIQSQSSTRKGTSLSRRVTDTAQKSQKLPFVSFVNLFYTLNSKKMRGKMYIEELLRHLLTHFSPVLLSFMNILHERGRLSDIVGEASD